ncbi:UDP-glucuronic acid decarboxylase 1 [Stylosanthes scabra]|uniref:UDP-glucuronate decarboxylase n=1 Tax=Stylosanthes scabra TaxID=79078 RepID=A0ABU6VD69_9FABA|nr:UDP-glucuronic acid decarboxylase 1 [Stylosanthes scabra]
MKLNHRLEMPSSNNNNSNQYGPYSPKLPKHNRSLPRSINYLLREQRLLFTLIGILIGSTFFIIQPILSRIGPSEAHPYIPNGFTTRHDLTTFGRGLGLEKRNAVAGRVPAAIGARRLRVVVTGGAGFVGSHLVDKLIERGNEVIVVDNFFTGRKENLVHLLGNPRFELIRHDVVEPILLEVDQIYHLACPASPVHYKYNPLKIGKQKVLEAAKRMLS